MTPDEIMGELSIIVNNLFDGVKTLKDKIDAANPEIAATLAAARPVAAIDDLPAHGHGQAPQQ